jgi:phosphate:Na+ symporter
MTSSMLLLTLLGTVALLLWGVRMVRTGMTRAFGPGLRSMLGRASGNRGVAFGTGVLVTALLQSATATTLLLASFAGRGLIALPIAIAMILGADVGSTLVAQLFAFDIKWLWSVAMLAGVVLFSTGEHERIRGSGRIAIGLGLMLLALQILGEFGGALRASPTMAVVLRALSAEAMIAVLVAALLTWLAHSSLAIILLIMSLAATGAIEPSLALALVIGANIGGSLAPIAILSDSPVAARRVPIGNFIARLVVSVPALLLVPAVVPALESLATGPDRLVLLFHTAFNVAVAAIFLPLLGPLAGFVERIVPDGSTQGDRAVVKNLDPSALGSPPEALGCAMRETLVVGDIVLDMLRRSLGAIEGNDPRVVKDIEKTDDLVDRLHEAIKHYLIRASRSDLTEAEAHRYVEILTFNANLEHIGDIIDRNLMELAAKKIRRGYAFSPEGLEELRRFHGHVVNNMRLALNVFATRDLTLARRLIAEKAAMRTRELEWAERHYARLKQGLAQSIETSAIHLDIIRDLKRINSHLTSAAYPILEAAGELRESRLRDRAPMDDGEARVPHSRPRSSGAGSV